MEIIWRWALTVTFRSQTQVDSVKTVTSRWIFSFDWVVYFILCLGWHCIPFVCVWQVWSDAVENDENLLVTGCGSTAPAVVTAPRNIMKARFQSTESAGKGFSASFYTSVYHMGVWKIYGLIPLFVKFLQVSCCRSLLILGCGANFTGTIGRVVSPNYPDHYPDGSNCNYIIDAGDQNVVVLTFKTFQLEGMYMLAKSLHCTRREMERWIIMDLIFSSTLHVYLWWCEDLQWYLRQ